MRIAIVGASGAGLYAALLFSAKHKEHQVVLIDKNKVIGKKLLATGNGHCNILPGTLKTESFSNPEAFMRYLGHRDLEDLKSTLESLGILLCEENNLYYPASYHAPTHVRFLEKSLIKNGVELHLDERVIDYRKEGKNYIISTEKGEICADFVIFATGGCSQSKFGSDGSLNQIFLQHGYRLRPTRPGLAPVKTKESTKALAGIRHHALCTLKKGNAAIHQEFGEVLFKKDGLSGICIFNLESVWVRQSNLDGYEISIDLYPEYSVQKLKNLLKTAYIASSDDYLDALLVKPLQDYLLFAAKRKYGNQSPESMALVMKDLVFHLDQPYGFDESQVTVGGILLDEVDGSFESKKEQGIYFIGECLDMDGLCGGNNLAWCLLGAIEVAESI